MARDLRSAEVGALGGGDDEEEDLHTLRINKSFASKYEQQRHKEELQRLQAKLGDAYAPATVDEVQSAMVPESESEDSRSVRGGIAFSTPRSSGYPGEEGQEEEEEEEEEEEDEGNIDPQKEEEFAEALRKIKERDSSIFDPNTKLYSDAEELEHSGAEDAVNNRGKPQYLKDVLAQQAVTYGPDGLSTEAHSSNFTGTQNERQWKTHAEEQEDVRQEFLKAANEQLADGSANDDEALEPVRKGGSGRPEEKEHVTLPERAKRGLERYFGEDESQLSEGDRFLRDYLMNRRWLSKSLDDVDENNDDDVDGSVPIDSSGSVYPADVAPYQSGSGTAVQSDSIPHRGATSGSTTDSLPNIADDEEHLHEQERFESAYNFRFEEPNATQLVAPGRRITDTLRRDDERRKRKRKEREERKQAEKERLQEEINRLKKLKRHEIENKLEEVKKAAGTSEMPIDPSQLDADFDPDEHDRQMQQQFDESFYQQEEHDPEELARISDLNENGHQSYENRAEHYAAPVAENVESLRRELGEHAKPAKHAVEEDENSDSDEEGATAWKTGRTSDGEESSGHAEELNRANCANEFSKKREKEWKRELRNKLREYDRMSAEDFVSGMPTRFKYREVKRDNYGLTTDEILALSDKELNQVVSVKKLAPYRENEAVRVNKEGLKKMRSRARQKLEELKRGPNRDEEVKEAAERVQSFAKPTKKGMKQADERADRVRKELEQAKQAEREKEFEGMSKSQKKNVKRRLAKKQAKNNVA